MDHVGDLPGVDDIGNGLRIDDVTAKDRDPCELVTRHQEPQPAVVRREVERNHVVALVEEVTNHPRTETAHAAGHEIPISHLVHRGPSIVDRSVPIRLIVTSTTSPTCNQIGGFMPIAVPDGVPVAMTSPGCRVIPWVMNSISCGMGKIMSDTGALWRSSPLTWVSMRSADTSAISSEVTRIGPSGQNVSSDLPRIHCRSPSWRSLALMSLSTVYPAT